MYILVEIVSFLEKQEETEQKTGNFANAPRKTRAPFLVESIPE